MALRLCALILCCILALCLEPDAAFAKAKKKAPPGGAEAEKKDGAVGYGGAQVQMMPFMAPYRGATGVRYQPLIARITLDSGVDERPACFTIPIIHDRILQYLFKANLTLNDFAPDHQELMEKKLFDVVLDTVGKGYYTGIKIIGADAPAMDNKSQTLSAQCK